MTDFVLMSDSCCDLPADLAAQLELDILPLSVLIDDVSYANYLDGREITSKDLYSRIRGGAMPTTSAVSVGLFEEAMKVHMDAGKDVLCISFSAALSTTHQSAVIAGQELSEAYPERTIQVLDSKCASVGQGLLLKLCAEKKATGATMAEVATYAVETASKIQHWFSVDDLNHLKRGGRISTAAAVVGSMLAIKPILQVTPAGTLESVGKERGRKTAMNALVKKVVELGVANDPTQTVFVGHGDCEEDAQYLVDQLKEKMGIEAPMMQCFGAVIGSHIGPASVGVFFLGNAPR